MSTERLYDMTFLNKISGGDQQFIREMIDTFKQVAPEYLVKASSYQASAAIEALSRETHRIIPGVSFLGAKSLEEDLMKIEDYTKRNVQLEELSFLLLSAEDKINRLIAQFDEDFTIEDSGLST